MAFPSLRNKGGKKARSEFTIVFICSTAKLDWGLQCVQRLSTPPGLPLHIHDVWLQLHHLLVQLFHLCLEIHVRISEVLPKGAHTDSHVETH